MKQLSVINYSTCKVIAFTVRRYSDIKTLVILSLFSLPQQVNPSLILNSVSICALFLSNQPLLSGHTLWVRHCATQDLIFGTVERLSLWPPDPKVLSKQAS